METNHIKPKQAIPEPIYWPDEEVIMPTNPPDR